MSYLSNLVLRDASVLDSFIATTPSYIERQEVEGQAAFVKAADRLPLAVNYPHGATHSIITRATGIKFGSVVDKIFVEATLPQGWKIVPTKHSMWSKLQDAKGNERASIFFKAVFYDYNAHISFECRYRVASYVELEANGSRMLAAQVQDSVTKDTLWTSEYVDAKDFVSHDAHIVSAKNWLNEKFPKHADPFEYWD